MACSRSHFGTIELGFSTGMCKTLWKRPTHYILSRRDSKTLNTVHLRGCGEVRPQKQTLPLLYTVQVAVHPDDTELHPSSRHNNIGQPVLPFFFWPGRGVQGESLRLRRRILRWRLRVWLRRRRLHLRSRRSLRRRTRRPQNVLHIRRHHARHGRRTLHLT